MINIIKQHTRLSDEVRLFILFLFVTLEIVSLAIFQDYLHSIRYGRSFYFHESLLFKTFWFYFPPILFVLRRELKKRQLKTISQICLAVIIPALAHLILVPITVWCLSSIFREQSYGIIKTLTFTLSNDLVKLLLIYSAFIGWLQYLAYKRPSEEPVKQPSSTQFLMVSSGKNSTRLDLSDILYIKAATPYVAIQLTDKEYLHSESLKSMATKLDHRFIRVHRSTIVNMDKVLSYKSRLNGDYDLVLQDDTEIRLSRNYVNDFRRCYDSIQPTA
ncbi:LytR/AlgR family response regulator transcription factor [Pleionea mediterranea]|uniref:LytTr DNA-binding domain-containing protein n=1 Tax=Pleionea mediterranea TaxID=523701 RepID=A0A316FXJ0_9GAMM|nr:LytTr DNA-binding domain-containing protein [Pleionea mediterranea]